MAGLIYDENALVSDELYKYDQFLHSRINKYTGDGRTLVTYYNINDANTSSSLGMNTNYQVLGENSPLRYDKIENMMLVDFSPLSPEDSQASTTNVRDYNLNGTAFVIPGTIMPKENDFFIINNINMNHIMRVTQVVQDGLNTDGSYKIMYSLFSTDIRYLEHLESQVIKTYVMDLQTIGGEDLTPVIGKEDYIYRDKLIKMVNDMCENYVARYYDQTHNCFLCRENGMALFDLCGNVFMAKHGVMMNDNSYKNIILNPDKLRDPRIDMLYQKSPYKWIERDAPYRYLDTFKYHLLPGTSYPDSSFARYGADDVQVMVPVDAWCDSPSCERFFPFPVYEILDNEEDTRTCRLADCKCCAVRKNCCNHYKAQRFDYVSLIHNFIYGRLTSISDLSLYIGDPLFDNALSKEIYLWTPIIIYIIKQVLKIK
jgi:hypothetical protein